MHAMVGEYQARFEGTTDSREAVEVVLGYWVRYCDDFVHARRVQSRGVHPSSSIAGPAPGLWVSKIDQSPPRERRNEHDGQIRGSEADYRALT